MTPGRSEGGWNSERWFSREARMPWRIAELRLPGAGLCTDRVVNWKSVEIAYRSLGK